MCQNNHDLIYNTNKAIPYYRLDHEFRPYLRSQWRACYLENEIKINNSLSQFRSASNYTCYLYSLYLAKNNKRQTSHLKLGYLASNANNNTINKVLTYADMLCVNDTADENNIYQNKLLRQYFKSKFGRKSNFELNDYTDDIKIESKQLVDNKEKDIRADGQPNTYLYF